MKRPIEYTIAAFPTLYGGRLYRSRLEAKWAAFFDLCGWEAEYEPFDLGDWSPDFLIRGSDSEILVEVKPITAIDVPTIWKMHKAAEQSGFKGDLLLVGSGVTHQSIGWMCTNMLPERPDSGAEREGYPHEIQMMPWFTEADSFCKEPPDVGISFIYDRTRGGVPSETGVMFRQKGKPDRFIGMSYSLKERWNEAASKVQWHRRP
jgi:hypothetical protein